MMNVLPAITPVILGMLCASTETVATHAYVGVVLPALE